jgi:hypothetical protein
LQRRVEALEAARMLESGALDVSGDPLDVMTMWLTEHVIPGSYYVEDDDEDWHTRGYL